MKRTALIGLAMLATVSLSSGLALAADPTLHEVYQAVEAGNLKQAETMMDQVLRDHPNSAKAHFVDAELLAKEGKLDMSRAELGTAERLAPGLPFAKPGAVAELKQRLAAPAARELRSVPLAAPAAATAPAAGFPWSMLLLGLAAVAAVIFFIRTLNRPRVLPAGGPGYAPMGPGGAPGGFPQPYGAGGMGPVGPTGGGMGSGILGGLATGAAVGAGIVAGEALMHKVFDGGSSHAAEPAHLQPPVDYPQVPDSNYDVGGSDFGVSDGGWDDGSSGGGSDDWN